MLLTRISVQLKAKAISGRDKGLSKGYLDIEASDGITPGTEEVVKVAA
jgi:hypothetical protein